MLGVDLELEDGAGGEVLVARQPLLQVAHGDRQLLDREIARVAHRHQRSTVGDELLQLLETRLADAAAIFGTDARRLVAVDDVARGLIGDDDRVEFLAEPAGPDVGVVDRRQVELVSLELSTHRVQFVHVAAGPRLHIATRGAVEDLAWSLVP
jgi:hypothetical protein